MLLFTLTNSSIVLEGFLDTDSNSVFSHGRNFHHSEISIRGEVAGEPIRWSGRDLQCDSVYSLAGARVNRLPSQGDTIYIGGNKSRHYICTANVDSDGQCEITPVR